ncbi:MAG: hypothetical protein WEB62_08210 [Bacteroidota bacterium]
MSVYHQAKGSIVLKLVIALLAGVLLWVLYEPYQIREQEDHFRRESRVRMQNIRSAQLKHIELRGTYSRSISELLEFVKAGLASDTLNAAIFKPLTSGTFVPESLLYSPKTWKLWELSVMDTTTIKKWYVEDPNGYGSIGTLSDDSKVNKASWEE